jgi:hypothetical protein
MGSNQVVTEAGVVDSSTGEVFDTPSASGLSSRW